MTGFRKRFSLNVMAGLLATSLLCFPLEGIAGASSPQGRYIVINTAGRTLQLYDGDEVIREYPVGVGKANFETPAGQFAVRTKVIDPIFEDPFKPPGRRRIKGARNPLGTRWIGFKPGPAGEYGIHGTNDPLSVGQYSSHGCVRMHIRDAEELFELVDFGTPVEVVYEPVVFEKEGNLLTLTVFPDGMGRGMPSAKQALEQILKRYPEADIDEGRIAEALSQPLGKPVPIGKMILTIRVEKQANNDGE